MTCEHCTTRWTPDGAGCIFAGASTRTADELNACVVLLALEQGCTEDGEDMGELRDLADRVEGWLEDHDESDTLTEAAQDVQDTLSVPMIWGSARTPTLCIVGVSTCDRSPQ